MAENHRQLDYEAGAQKKPKSGHDVLQIVVLSIMAVIVAAGVLLAGTVFMLGWLRRRGIL